MNWRDIIWTYRYGHPWAVGLPWWVRKLPLMTYLAWVAFIIWLIPPTQSHGMQQLVTNGVFSTLFLVVYPNLMAEFFKR